MLLRIKLNLRNSIEIKSLEINQKLKRESIHTQFVLLVTELVGTMKLGVKMFSLVLTLILMLMLIKDAYLKERLDERLLLIF